MVREDRPGVSLDMWLTSRSTRLPTYKFHRATDGIRLEHGYKPSSTGAVSALWLTHDLFLEKMCPGRGWNRERLTETHWFNVITMILVHQPVFFLKFQIVSLLLPFSWALSSGFLPTIFNCPRHGSWWNLLLCFSLFKMVYPFSLHLHCCPHMQSLHPCIKVETFYLGFLPTDMFAFQSILGQVNLLFLLLFF